MVALGTYTPICLERKKIVSTHNFVFKILQINLGFFCFMLIAMYVMVSNLKHASLGVLAFNFAGCSCHA